MPEPIPDGELITRLVWEAASAAAVGDHDAAQVCVNQLVGRNAGGSWLHIAAVGWAALVAEHVSGGSTNYRFSSKIENPDEKTEIFAAIVCAVGNRDCAGATALLRQIHPVVAYDSAVLLLYGAGSALAAGYRTSRRR